MIDAKSAKNISNTNMLIPIETAYPIGSLEAYMYWVNKLPILSKEDELSLAKQFRENGDLAAAKKLVMAHLRFVVRIAQGFSGYGLALADLIQEGNVGLMKAVKRFDPKIGVRLVTFAVHWIKSEIHEFILRNWRIVKVATTKAQRKLFFNLRKSTKRLGWFSDDEAAAVAKNLNVSKKDVQVMEGRLLNGADVSFHAEENDAGEDNYYAPENYLTDLSFDVAASVENEDSQEKLKARLHKALASLDKRSREIIELRFLSEEKPTLHELAAKYSISAERIRQLEVAALGKVKDFLGEAN